MWWDGLSLFNFKGGSYKLNRTKKDSEPTFKDRLMDLQGIVMFVLAIAVCAIILQTELKNIGKIKTSSLELVLLRQHEMDASKSLRLVMKTSYNADDLSSLVRNAN